MIFCGVEGEVVIDEGLDILFAVTEGGEVDIDDVEAVEEVFAEGAVADHFFEVAVGGADEAEVHGDGGGAAEAFEGFGF